MISADQWSSSTGPTPLGQPMTVLSPQSLFDDDDDDDDNDDDADAILSKSSRFSTL
jgi:hypothetical protein